MNGRKCKALRRAVRRLRGYGPAGMNILNEDPETGLIQYEQSEWRKIKKHFKRNNTVAAAARTIR